MKISKCVYILFVFIVTSCKSQTPLPDVYLGFKLGSSQSQMIQRRDELVKSGLIQIKENLFVHTSTAKDNSTTKRYFSTPVFSVSPGDTQCSKITIVYFDEMKYTADIAQKISEVGNSLQFYITEKVQGERMPGNIIKNDVISELVKKYGKIESSDSSYDATGIYQERYVWATPNGLDINLNFGYWKSQMIEAGALRLDFTFNTETRKRLIKKVTPY